MPFQRYHRRGLIALVGRTGLSAVLLLSSGTRTAMRVVSVVPSWQSADSLSIPGMPNQPALVTVIPFVEKPGASEEEQTKVVIPATVDGRTGRFIVDLGAPQLFLNRTFLQPSATGGVDTVTPATRRPERSGNGPASWDSVHVRVQLGTLPAMDVVDPTLARAMTRPTAGAAPRPVNAVVNHEWGNFYNFAPRLGNLSLSVFEPYETILDYTHRRVVLIRLDAKGHRRVAVPAYTPVWSAPLVEIDLGAWLAPQGAGQHWWGVRVQRGAVIDSMLFDTGSPLNAMSDTLLAHLGLPRVPGVLDSVGIADRRFTVGYGVGLPRLNILGYPFLQQCGVVGFNHRTHQFLLYQAR